MEKLPEYLSERFFYSARFKFQVILEVLKGLKTIRQIACSYGVLPIMLSHWKKEFMEKGPELFSQQTTIHEYEKKIQELERSIGHKEVEIALLKNLVHLNNEYLSD